MSSQKSAASCPYYGPVDYRHRDELKFNLVRRFSDTNLSRAVTLD